MKLFAINETIHVTRRKIIEFGVVLFVMLSIVIPIIILWQNDWIWQNWLDWTFALGMSFLILCLSTGTKMAPFYLAWMKFALILGTIVTGFIVSLVFLFLITPVGLIKRLSNGKTDYSKEFKTTHSSYWIESKTSQHPNQMEKMY